MMSRVRISSFVVLSLLPLVALAPRAWGQEVRARDLGIPFDGRAGALGAITDVAGVEVGHVTLIEGEGALRVGSGPVRTGVTVIHPRGRSSTDPVFAGWFTLNASGEMTGTTWLQERGLVDGPIAITNTHSVGVVRDAAVAWMVEQGWPAAWHAPVVGETYDGALNDINGFHVTRDHALEAMRAARGGRVQEGAVGGGTGMVCNGFKGGIGTASRVFDVSGEEFTVGVLVQCNYNWGGDDLRLGGVAVSGLLPVGRHCFADRSIERHADWYPYCDDTGEAELAQPGRDGSIIVVIATDAPLLPHQLARLAKRPSLGLGRLGAVSQAGSGDIFIAFSTANAGRIDENRFSEVEAYPNDQLSRVFQAAVQATEEAIVNAMVAAETMVGAGGLRVAELPEERVREIFASRESVITPVGSVGPATAAGQETEPVSGTPAELVAGAAADEWRRLDPADTVYFQLPDGQLVMELAPWAAPRHVERLKALVRGGHFDGAAVVRSQDNYVAQWAADLPEGGAEGIADSLSGELVVDAADLPFTPLPDADVYAPAVGFTRGFPVGRDPATGETWIAHCYGVVGVARGDDPDSGNASQLYAVTGHGPRHLDRNATMLGRVVAGMEHLTTLPRGTGNLGFYETPEERVPIVSARVGSDLPPEQRIQLELLRTDSDSFRDYVLAYRTRAEDWFVHKADRVDLCNVRIPARPIGGADAPGAAASHEGAEEAIRSRRAAFNDAIAAHDAAAAVSFLDSDYQITTGAGELSQGRYTETASWQGVFATAEDIVYVRTPERVDVASTSARAYESGRWRGSWTAADGPQELGGRYTAHWRLVDGEWRIRSEIFVTLWCDGPDCSQAAPSESDGSGPHEGQEQPERGAVLEVIGHEPDQQAAVLEAMDRYLVAMSVNDLRAMEGYQTADGMTYTARSTEDGGTRVVGRPNSYWVDPARAGEGSVLERYWSPTVLVRGPIAVLWAPYEFRVEGETTHCGIDVFDFVQIDGAWTLANSMWTVEPGACDELQPGQGVEVRPGHR